MIDDIEALRAELSSLAMKVARLLTAGHYDQAEVAELNARREELREKIRQAEAPARGARADAACIYRPR
jgi:uncharacterized protein involved in exopolysaccharide biosynthesis